MDTPGIHLAKKISKMGMKVHDPKAIQVKACQNVTSQSQNVTILMILIVCAQCSDTAVIYFDDVRVPAKNIIGEEGGLWLSLKDSKYISNTGWCVTWIWFWLLLIRYGLHLPDDAVPRGKVRLQNNQTKPKIIYIWPEYNHAFEIGWQQRPSASPPVSTSSTTPSPTPGTVYQIDTFGS